MWPTKPDLGPQLTYGVSGNGILVPEADEANNLVPKVHFPRLRNHGTLLSPVFNSRTWIHEKNPEPEEEGEKDELPAHHNASLNKVAAVPEKILTAMTNGAAILEDPTVVDPTRDSMCAIMEIGMGGYSNTIIVNGKRQSPKAKQNLVQMQAVAYVSEAARSVLNISVLMPKRKRFFLFKESPDVLELERKVTVGLPSKKVSVDFETDILQIVPFPYLKLLGIRTGVDFTILQESWNNDPDIRALEFRKVATLTTLDLKGKRFAHVSVNPFLKYDFLIADVEGHVGLWQVRTANQEQKCTKFDEFKFPQRPGNFSSWWKFAWFGVERLYSFTRTDIVTRTLPIPGMSDEPEEAIMEPLVTAIVWSHIQDVAVAGPYAFLLTSKEILWTELGKDVPMRRILSWKHFLDDTDITYRLTVIRCDEDQTYVVAAYSAASPLIMMYTFGFVEGRPCMTKDPYYLRANCESLSGLSMAKSAFSGENKNTIVNVVEVGKDGSVCHYVLSGTRKRAFRVVFPKKTPQKPDPYVQLFSRIQVREAVAAYVHLSNEELLPQETPLEDPEKGEVGKEKVRDKKIRESQESQEELDELEDGEEGEDESLEEEGNSLGKKSELGDEELSQSESQAEQNFQSESQNEQASQAESQDELTNTQAEQQAEDSRQDELIQSLAQELGTATETFEAGELAKLIDTDIEVPVPLHSIADIRPQITDHAQLDVMLDQLKTYYDGDGLKLENHLGLVLTKADVFTKSDNENENQNETGNENEYENENGRGDRRGPKFPASLPISSLSKYLRNHYKHSPHVEYASTLLAARMLTVRKKQPEHFYQPLIEEIYKRVPPEAQAVLDEWTDSESPQEDTASQGSQLSQSSQVSLVPQISQSSQVPQVPQVSQVLQSAVPTIKTEAKNETRKVAKKPKHDLLHMAISQSQSRHSQGMPNGQSQTQTTQSSTEKKSQPTPLSSQSIKRPGTQPLSQKKKKKKGGFA